MNIIVLAGGTSSERDVSLVSGTLIWKALNNKKHNAVLLDVSLGLENQFHDFNEIFENRMSFIDLDKVGIKPFMEKNVPSDYFINEGVLALCRIADIVFIALHGENGEDGKLQAVFDLMGIKYTGSGYLASAIAMDKYMSKKVFQSDGICVPKGILVEQSAYNINDLIETIGMPCVIKPTNCGSSVGISIVENELGLCEALAEGFKYSSKILIEEFIEGREFSVGILGQEVLPVIEIISEDGFYDYYKKYQCEKVREICPAELTHDQASKMKSIAWKAFESLGLRDYCRVDLMMDKEENIFVLEVNSLPGMTPTSLLPQEALAVDISYEELCDKIISLALSR